MKDTNIPADVKTFYKIISSADLIWSIYFEKGIQRKQILIGQIVSWTSFGVFKIHQPTSSEESRLQTLSLSR